MNRSYIQQLAKGLGWRKPEFHTHRLTGKPAVDYGANIVEWAECRISDSFFMQINSLPRHFEDYSLCVYAIRFQICSGWRDIRLTEDHRQRVNVMKTIQHFFDFKLFATADARALYRKEFPHSKRYTWARIQAEGAPNFTELIR